MAGSEHQGFSEFLKAFDRHTILALIPILALPFVLDQLFSLQPPWPRHSTYATAFLELAALFLAFFVQIPSRKRLVRRQVVVFALIVLAFIAYFALYSIFVFETPLTGEKVIAGFRCTQQAERYIAPALMQHCPFLNEQALAAAQYEAEVVWTPLSVRLVEIALFIAWSSFFVLATFLFGISVAFMHRARRARRPPDNMVTQ